MTAQTEAQLIADALDDEFAQGRISNHTGRKAAAELRRLEAANAELLEALSTYVSFAAMRREHLGKLSPVMEAVDAKARAAIRARKPA